MPGSVKRFNVGLCVEDLRDAAGARREAAGLGGRLRALYNQADDLKIRCERCVSAAGLVLDVVSGARLPLEAMRAELKQRLDDDDPGAQRVYDLLDEVGDFLEATSSE